MLIDIPARVRSVLPPTPFGVHSRRCPLLANVNSFPNIGPCLCLVRLFSLPTLSPTRHLLPLKLYTSAQNLYTAMSPSGVQKTQSSHLPLNRNRSSSITRSSKRLATEGLGKEIETRESATLSVATYSDSVTKPPPLSSTAPWSLL